jgi:PEP-CTERM motif
MSKKLVSVCLSIFCMGLFAHADTIGPNNCGSCLGSSYTLTYASAGSPNTFDVSLVINATGFTNSNTDLLNAVSLKVVSQTSNISSVTLLSPPATFSSTVLTGGLSAAGCDGSGNGFFCSQSTSGLQVGHAGDIYTFTYLLTLTNGSSLTTGNLAASVKALYVDSTGKQNGITSEDITLQPGITTSPVPEPGTLALMGTGFIGLALVSRKAIA